MSNRLDLTSLATYAESCRRLAAEDLAGLNLDQVAHLESQYNAYPHQDTLEAPRHLLYLEDHLDDTLITRAKNAILDGLIFWEHAAAGEATRLGLGPKYLINPWKLTPPATSIPNSDHPLLPLTLGGRHMAQWIFEISRLAEEAGLDPAGVLARQQSLLVINEDIKEAVLQRIHSLNFLGLNPANFLFLVQPAFPALTPSPSQSWQYDENSPKRLHNHGQMALQKTMDHQVFHLDQSGHPQYLSWPQFRKRLQLSADLVSYNIEDLDYLNTALDFETIGLALVLAEQGQGMVMEIVANNPHRPIKGGACFFDPNLGRDVVIEGFRLNGLADYPSYLNKNFNHYPQPARIFSQLREEGLFMPLTVKDEGLYFQPVQGDLNFLGPTTFVTRRTPKTLSSWKTQDDTPVALEAMTQQDLQPGFAPFLLRMGAITNVLNYTQST